MHRNEPILASSHIACTHDLEGLNEEMLINPKVFRAKAKQLKPGEHPINNALMNPDNKHLV